MVMHFHTKAQAKVGKKQRGKASYYEDKFNGKKTASGEIFNNGDYTAAHRTLPFNTMLKVTNVKTGKAVVLRVNDRGPFSRNRILDVTKVAAKDLDMIKDGSIAVEIEILPPNAHPGRADNATITKKERKEQKNTPPKNDNSEKNKKENKEEEVQLATGKTYSVWLTERQPIGYGIQVFSFREKENAIEKGKEIVKAGIEEVYIQVGWQGIRRIYRVLLGQYATPEQAKSAVEVYQKKGYRGFSKPHFKPQK
jgi:rare lipoprotein A